MNLILVPPLVVTLLSGAVIGYTAHPNKPWSVTQVVRTRYITIATRQALPEGWRRARPAPWGNIYRELKMARKPVASITKPAPAKVAKIVKPAAKHKIKPRCRKGEKQWYWNKKKGRKMYRTRKLC